jgi:hypothetical protein
MNDADQQTTYMVAGLRTDDYPLIRLCIHVTGHDHQVSRHYQRLYLPSASSIDTERQVQSQQEGASCYADTTVPAMKASSKSPISRSPG